MATYTTLAEWIAREALPFTLTAPDTFNLAADTLIARLGAEIDLLGFGEALHGGEDLLILRNRLFQRLVAAHGYTAIAVESSFPRGHYVNEYVQGRGPAGYDAVQERGFSHGFGCLAQNRALVEWLREYNTDPAHGVPLHFYGCDSPTEMIGSDSPRQALYFVLDYLTAADRASGETYRARIDALLGDDAAWENPAASMDPAQSIGRSPEANALRLATEELLSELTTRRPALVAHSGAEYFAEAVQYARVARQLLTYHALLADDTPDRIAKLLGIRDAMMADNLAYIVTRERPRGKVLAFAHNGHLQRGATAWQLGPHALTWWPAGAHLAALFGPRYAVIGSGVGVSEENGIGQPEAGTLEAQLTAAPGPGRFTPTHQGRGLPAAEIAALPLRTLSAKNSTYLAPLAPRSFTDFDAWAVLDSTTYAAGGPPLP